MGGGSTPPVYTAAHASLVTASPPPHTSRLILYHQTHHTSSGTPISALPLIGTGVMHVYIAAIHLNESPEDITLNDNPPNHERNTQLWEEVKILRQNGIKVMAMLGGAAKGSYARLSQDFEGYYAPLYSLLTEREFDGVDLDIEENTDIDLVTRLLTRLKKDFGDQFICTLAPVMSALLPCRPWLQSFCYRLLHPEMGDHPSELVRAFIKASLLRSRGHLSGFNHFELEASEAGKLVDWYNVQFYCGWGDAGDPNLYTAMVDSGWNPRKLVLGAVTNPGNGSGYVDVERLGRCIRTLVEKYGDDFGGVMGWEYFNAGVSEGLKPEEWVRRVAGMLGKQPYACTWDGCEGKFSTESNMQRHRRERHEIPDLRDAQGNPVDTRLTIQRRIARSIDAATSGTNSSSADASQSQDSVAAAAAAAVSATTIMPTSSSEHVQQLVDMGFERAEAVAALEAMGGDVDAAAGLLFGD